MWGKARAAIVGVLWCGLGGGDEVGMFSYSICFFLYDVWAEGWFFISGS